MRRLIPGSRTTAGRRAPPRRRNRQRGRTWRRLARFALPAVGLLLLVGAGLRAWESDWLARKSAWVLQRYFDATADAGLAVADVLVEGRKRTPGRDVLAALGVSRGAPILALDPTAARRRLEALAWVRGAVVERRLPDRVHVRLDERMPMAVWQHHGRLRVIDYGGEPIPGADPGRFAGLPRVVGPGAPEHTARLLRVLGHEPRLKARVAAAVRVGERRWNIRLRNGVDVQLPEEGMPGAWTQLARLERRHRVLQRDVRVIDLRLPDRLVVRMAPGAEPYREMPGPGEST